MSLERLLEDWTEYNNLNVIKRSQDEHLFFMENWEVDFLAKKFKSIYPGLTEQLVKDAIALSSRQLGIPQPRKLFVECVKLRLGL